MLLPLTTLLVLQRILQRDWRGLGQILLVCLAGALLQLFFILPVFSTTLDNPAYTESGGEVRHSLDLLGVIVHAIFPGIRSTASSTSPMRCLGNSFGERSAWIGLVAGALALLALVRGRGRFWLGLALLAWLLALGPLLNLLGESGYRAGGWSCQLRDLAVGALAGLAADTTRAHARAFQLRPGAGHRLPRHAGRGPALRAATFSQPPAPEPCCSLLLLAAVLFDYQWFWPFRTRDSTIPVEITALGQRDDLRAVLDVPVRQTGPPTMRRSGCRRHTNCRFSVAT